eukprot:CAMPEP_0194481870 /NCGR_PEP_ID=MMETSP0253-20130528/4088_1 /TAXON_ID=2966 /ORGANISM="Noctiluca scintillans" /LENGTH=130 /DNA_ID=CAMNT_0039321377 /DNA_START=53 /DNA_END=445 /DNA_ORIENTATION=+
MGVASSHPAPKVNAPPPPPPPQPVYGGWCARDPRVEQNMNGELIFEKRWPCSAERPVPSLNLAKAMPHMELGDPLPQHSYKPGGTTIRKQSKSNRTCEVPDIRDCLNGTATLSRDSAWSEDLYPVEGRYR